jgi:hypothetical protein
MRLRILFYVSSILSAIFLFSVSACRCKKDIKQTTQTDTTGKCRMDFKTARTLSTLLKKNEFHSEWLSGKFDAELLVNGKKSEFTVVLRMRTDSVIWMSIIDPLIGAVEAARILLTKDSIRLMDRLHNTAFVGTYDTLCRLLHTDVDYEMLQSILMGNSVEFYDEDEKLKPNIDRSRCNYVLGTVRKKKIRKVMDGQKELKEPAQSIWMTDIGFKIVRIFFTDLNTNRTFDANYENFQVVDGIGFPHKMTFLVKAEKNLEIRFSYKKLTLNKPTTFPFNIPNSYEIYRKK